MAKDSWSQMPEKNSCHSGKKGPKWNKNEIFYVHINLSSLPYACKSQNKLSNVKQVFYRKSSRKRLNLKF